MVKKTKRLVIIGDSAFAEIAYEYFTHDSEYEILGFAVESAYLSKKILFGLPIVPYEEIEKHFDPNTVEFYAALVYTQLNRLRTRLFYLTKAKGYKPASYISSRAFVWPNVEFKEHCFIFEDNTLQPFVKIGNNVVLWSGNHVGHHSEIQDHCFIASHAVISGFCNIGSSSFIGVNATLANNIQIGANNWIGLAATITKNTPDNLLVKGPRSEPANISAKEFFNVVET